MRHFSAPSLIWALAILLPVAALVSITVGTVDISLLDGLAALTGSSINSQTHTILIDIRLPRILLAIAVGAVLASTGAVMQGLFRNPLADPSLIGVSSGASVGASLMIVTAGGFIKSGALLGLSLVAVGAFVGGFAATLLVYRLATSGIGTSVTTMLLAGIAIGALAGALNSLLSYFSDNDMLIYNMACKISYPHGLLFLLNNSHISLISRLVEFIIRIIKRLNLLIFLQ